MHSSCSTFGIPAPSRMLWHVLLQLEPWRTPRVKAYIRIWFTEFNRYFKHTLARALSVQLLRSLMARCGCWAASSSTSVFAILLLIKGKYSDLMTNEMTRPQWEQGFVFLGKTALCWYQSEWALCSTSLAFTAVALLLIREGLMVSRGGVSSQIGSQHQLYQHGINSYPTGHGHW